MAAGMRHAMLAFVAGLVVVLVAGHLLTSGPTVDREAIAAERDQLLGTRERASVYSWAAPLDAFDYYQHAGRLADQARPDLAAVSRQVILGAASERATRPSVFHEPLAYVAVSRAVLTEVAGHRDRGDLDGAIHRLLALHRLAQDLTHGGALFSAVVAARIDSAAAAELSALIPDADAATRRYLEERWRALRAEAPSRFEALLTEAAALRISAAGLTELAPPVSWAPVALRHGMGMIGFVRLADELEAGWATATEPGLAIGDRIARVEAAVSEAAGPGRELLYGDIAAQLRTLEQADADLRELDRRLAD